MHEQFIPSMKKLSGGLATETRQMTGSRRRRNRPLSVLLVAVAVSLSLGGTLFSTQAQAASTASFVNVLLVCPAGQQPVGMWYQTQVGGSAGWTTWTGPTTNGTQHFTFTAPRTISDAYLTIGCGGSRAAWGHVYRATINVFRVPSQNFVVDCSVRSTPDCAVTYVQR